MDLKDFVAESLKQVIDGVLAAQEYGREKGARVNPLHLPVRDAKGNEHSVVFRNDIAHEIEFDIAVTATRGTQTKGGIGITVGAVTLGSTGQSKKDNELVSRIKFSIPIVLPTEK